MGNQTSGEAIEQQKPPENLSEEELRALRAKAFEKIITEKKEIKNEQNVVISQPGTPISPVTATTKTSIPRKTPFAQEAKKLENVHVKPKKEVEKLTPEKIFHNVICDVFDCTLDQNSSKFHLKCFAEKHDLITENDIEDVLAERCAQRESQTVYLIKTYRNLLHEIAKIEKSKLSASGIATRLRSYIPLILTYFTIELEKDGKVDSELFKLLIPSLDDDSKISHEFLTKVIELFDDHELDSIFKGLLQKTLNLMLTKHLTDDFMPPIQILTFLTNFEVSCRVLTTSPVLVPDRPTGIVMETKSFFGPFFALSSLNSPENLFKDLQYMQEADIEIVQGNIQNGLRMMHSELKNLLSNLLESKYSKEKTTSWIIQVLETNKSRAMMREDVNSCSRDGFLLNFSAVLLKLVNYKNLNPNSIQSDYAMVKSPIDFANMTKFGKVENFQVKTVEFGFETQLFYWIHRSLQLGYLNTFGKYKQLVQDTEKTWKTYQSVQGNEMEAPRALEQYVKLLSMQLGVMTHMFDNEFINNILSFYSFTCRWLRSLVDFKPNGELPLPTPVSFSIQNEIFLEGMIDFVTSLTYHRKNHFDSIVLDEIIHTLILFMENQEYVMNPHIKSKIPQLLGTLTMDTGVSKDRFLETLNHSLPQTILIPNLLRLYVSVERTGSSQQFYTKFEPRYFSALLLKTLWQLKPYRDCFVQNSKEEDTLKFFNMVLNDATYLLDESIKNLQVIHTFEKDSSSSSWSQVPILTRRDRETEYAQSEKTTTSLLNLANETVHMVSYMSKDICEPFLKMEMLPRLASMLNYFLVELVGPKCVNLRVKTPEKYKFDPKNLLTEICDIYLNLSEFHVFLKEIAMDGRSFSLDLFENTLSVLKRIKTRDTKMLQKFEDMIQKLDKISMEIKVEEEDLGDIPDEFTCPITCVLMEDPVLLPSEHVVDRQAIVRHLLNDPTDPFTRQALEVSQLVPQPELKQKIQEWKASKKK